MLMEIRDLKVGYARKTVVHGISMTVDKSEILTIIGHNGAGKTTTLKGVVGILKPSDGEVLYRGYSITGRSAMANVQDGLVFIPQDRSIFPDLKVRDNLEVGAYTVESKTEIDSRLQTVHELFPILEKREWQKAKTLSGGEQRMLSFGIALMMRPTLLLLDEPSLGLAPILVEKLMGTVREFQQTLGMSIILVEQNVKQALRIAHRAYVMKIGRIVLEKSGEELLQRGEWWDLF